MPSFHAQFAGFFSTYLFLFFLLHPQTPHPISNIGLWKGTMPTWVPHLALQPPVESALSPTAMLWLVCLPTLTVFAPAVSASRVVLRQHTVKQVLAGHTLGVCWAAVWFVFAQVCRDLGVVVWLSELWLAKLFGAQL